MQIQSNTVNNAKPAIPAKEARAYAAAAENKAGDAFPKDERLEKDAYQCEARTGESAKIAQDLAARIAQRQEQTAENSIESAPDGQPPETPAADAPHQKEPQKCTTDTDQVDDEIERLKQEAQRLKRELQKADGADKEDAERQLKQAERELAQKDNDAYRRAHAVVTNG